MSVTTEEVRTIFTADTGDLEEKAERGAKAIEEHGKAAERGSKGLDVHLASERRVAHNLGEITRSMLSGADAGEVLSESILRVGESFKTGLAIGGAVTVGYALYEGFTKASEAAVQLQEDIARINRPLGNGSLVAVGDINKQQGEASAKLDELAKRDSVESHGWQGVVSTVFRHAVGWVAGAGSTKQQVTADEKQKADLQKTASSDIDKLAQKMRDQNKVDRIRLMEGERAAQLRAAELSHNERAYELSQQPIGVNNNRARKAENVRAHNEAIVINRRFDLQKQALQWQTEIAKIGQTNLSIDAQQISALRGVVAMRQDALRTASGEEEIAQRTLELTQARSALKVGVEAITFARQQEYDLARATTRELELHALGEDRAAAAVKTRADFEARIAALKRQGRDGTAREQQKQEFQTLFGNNIDEIMKTPGQLRHDRQKEQRQQLRASHAMERLRDEADRVNRGAYGRSDAGTAHEAILKEILTAMRQAWN